MRAADDFNGDRRAVRGLTMQHKIVAALLARIPRKAGIIIDILQRASNGSIAEDDAALEVRYRFTQEIRACRNIGIDRQAY